MGKAKMIGQFASCTPNSRADMRRAKAWKRNREYTDKHEEVMAAKREEQQLRELEKMKNGN